MDFKKLFAVLIAALIGIVPAVAVTSNFAITDVNYDDPVAPGATLPVTITLENTDLAKDVESITVKAWLVDASGDLIGDKYKTEIVQVHNDGEKDVNFNIVIPKDVDDGKYTLLVTANGEWENTNTKVSTSWEGIVEVEQNEDSLAITDAQLSASTVSAGDSVDAAVTVLNNGQSDEENVKVRVTIGSAEASVAIPLLQEGDEQIVYMTLQLPKDLPTGIQTIKAQAYNSFASATATKDIVVESIKVQAQATQTATQQTFSVQTVPIGKGSIFTLQVTNNGAEPATFSFALGGLQDWASNARVDPATVALGAGETTSVQVHLIPTAGGEHAFALFVRAAGSTVATQIVKVNVSGAPIQATGNTAGLVVLGAIVLLALFAYFRGSNTNGKKQLYY